MKRDLWDTSREKLWFIGAILALLALAGALIATGCTTLSVGLRTAELRELQHRSVEWCRKDSRACPAARSCAAGAVKASEAWVAVAAMRKADALALRGGSPVNLAQLQQQEAEAQGLSEVARCACDPAQARDADGRLLLMDSHEDGGAVDAGIRRDLGSTSATDAGVTHAG